MLHLHTPPKMYLNDDAVVLTLLQNDSSFPPPLLLLLPPLYSSSPPLYSFSSSPLRPLSHLQQLAIYLLFLAGLAAAQMKVLRHFPRTLPGLRLGCI